MPRRDLMRTLLTTGRRKRQQAQPMKPLLSRMRKLLRSEDAGHPSPLSGDAIGKWLPDTKQPAIRKVSPMRPVCFTFVYDSIHASATCVFFFDLTQMIQMYKTNPKMDTPRPNMQAVESSTNFFSK